MSIKRNVKNRNGKKEMMLMSEIRYFPLITPDRFFIERDTGLHWFLLWAMWHGRGRSKIRDMIGYEVRPGASRLSPTHYWADEGLVITGQPQVDPEDEGE